jgi:hypothetical protein
MELACPASSDTDNIVKFHDVAQLQVAGALVPLAGRATHSTARGARAPHHP